MKYYITVLIIMILMAAGMFILPAEGYAGLFRLILFNLIIIALFALVLYLLLLSKNIKLNVILSVLAVIIVTAAISFPVLKDFAAELHYLSCDTLSVNLTIRKDIRKMNRYYLSVPSGEKIEVSSSTYFSLQKTQSRTVNIEYFPNTKLASKVTLSHDQ